jgi:hypothetical protein
MDFYKMMELPNSESNRIAEIILFQFDESLKSKIEQYLNWLFDIECMLDDTAGMYKNLDNDEGFLFHWEYRTDKIREKLDDFLNLQPLKLQLLLLKILLNIDMNRDILNEKNYPFIHWRDNHFLKEIILQKQKSIVSKLPKDKLTLEQIALKSVYEGLSITRVNANQIAKENGHNSGEKLFQRFTHYSNTQNRKGKPNPLTAKKFQNKIELFESVIELLPEPNKQRAIDELNILKKLFESEFE